ncbi:polysaccharide deacetylase family protein [Symbiobacterium thermophilum]|nr:polysaccharide deacetylase family protein [Symbiobacterium thermophilum]
MGPFLSHLAKVFLLVALLAQAGAVAPAPAAAGPEPSAPEVRVVPPPSAPKDAPADPSAAVAPGGQDGSAPADAEAKPAGGPGEEPAGQPPAPAGPVSPDPLIRLPTEAKEVVLTIDDGPGPLTERFLAVLEAEEVPAVFFWLSGSRSLPLAAEVVRQGHQIGTHTVSHPRLLQLQPGEAAAQITESQAALEAAAGVPVRFFRPPYGEHDRQIREIAAARGMSTVLWTVDSRDWALADDPEQIVANVLQQVKPGALILIHERAQTLAVLPDLIRALREAGYTFIPLPEPDPLPRAVASDG